MNSNLNSFSQSTPLPSATSYLIYARKSQESEERQVQSIDDQVGLARQLAQRCALPLYAEPVTESFSAKEPWQRREFERLIQLIEKGKVDGIVAWHPDRLSRNETDAATLCRLLRKGRLRDVRFVNYHFDNSPEGLMMLQMALSQSQYFSSKLALDVRRGLNSKLQKGWWPHRAPEGYLNDLETHTIVTDPERLPLIERAFGLLLTGAYTVTEVLEMMNTDWGYRTRRHKNTGGQPLSRSAGHRLFRNVFYTGRMLRGGEILSGSHPPILTLPEFHRVQTLLGRGPQGKGGYQKRSYVFNRIMRCARCGSAVVGSFQCGRHGKSPAVYYSCGGTSCPAAKKTIREDRLQTQVEAELERVTWPTWCKPLILDELKHYYRQEFAALERVTEQQAQALANAERKRSNLLDLKLEGEIDSALFGEKDRQLKAEIETLRGSVQGTQARFDGAFETVNRVCDFLLYGQQTFQFGDLDKKREVLSALGAWYRFDEGQVTIETNPLLPYRLQGLGIGPVEPEKDIEVIARRDLLEPPESGSRSTKKTDSGESVPVGWAHGNSLEPLFTLFNGALGGQLFPLLEYIE